MHSVITSEKTPSNQINQRLHSLVSLLINNERGKNDNKLTQAQSHRFRKGREVIV